MASIGILYAPVGHPRARNVSPLRRTTELPRHLIIIIDFLLILL